MIDENYPRTIVSSDHKCGSDIRYFHGFRLIRRNNSKTGWDFGWHLLQQGDYGGDFQAGSRLLPTDRWIRSCEEREFVHAFKSLPGFAFRLFVRADP